MLLSIFDDWKRSQKSSEEQTIMRKYGKSGLRNSAFYFGISYFTCSVWLTTRFLFIDQIYKITGFRDVLFDTHFHFNTSTSPGWEIVTGAQFFCTYMNMTTNSGINGFFVVLVLHLCGQLVIVKNQFENLTSCEDVGEKITHLIKRHNELKRFFIEFF